MKLFLKITHLKSQPHLPGDNESSFRVASYFLMSYFISVASVHTFPLFLFSPLTYVSQANHIPSLDSVSVKLIRSNDVSQSQLFFQIEELAMIPAKEAKEMLYRMFGEGFITLTVS